MLTASYEALHSSIISQLSTEFSMTDLGAFNSFLAISVTRDAGGHKHYATDTLTPANMSSCQPLTTSIDTQAKLSANSGP